MNLETQDRSVRRLQDKLKPLANGRALCETENLDDAEVVVVSYGITSRVAQRAIQTGPRAGRPRRQVPHHLRLAVPRAAHPRPRRPRQGVRRARAQPRARWSTKSRAPRQGKAKVIPVTHAGGSVHNPDAILKAIMEAAR